MCYIQYTVVSHVTDSSRRYQQRRMTVPAFDVSGVDANNEQRSRQDMLCQLVYILPIQSLTRRNFQRRHDARRWSLRRAGALRRPWDYASMWKQLPQQQLLLPPQLQLPSWKAVSQKPMR